MIPNREHTAPRYTMHAFFMDLLLACVCIGSVAAGVTLIITDADRRTAAREQEKQDAARARAQQNRAWLEAHPSTTQETAK